MDEVDQKQQDEIIALQKKDIQHDAQLSMWTKISMVMFSVVLALFVGGMIMTPYLMMSQKQESAFWCPHDGCPHHNRIAAHE